MSLSSAPDLQLLTPATRAVQADFNLLDAPEFLWEVGSEIEESFVQACAAQDLEQRLQILNKKLDCERGVLSPAVPRCPLNQVRDFQTPRLKTLSCWSWRIQEHLIDWSGSSLSSLL